MYIHTYTCVYILTYVTMSEIVELASQFATQICLGG